MNKWKKLAERKTIDRVIKALKANGIESIFVETGTEAKDIVLRLLPEGAEVMTMSSVTLATLGIADDIENSGRYDAVRKRLNSMYRKTQEKEMQRIGAAPDWAVGSVHAVTEDGKILVASNTGSQLPAYAYGARHVIWVVGAQKIVKNEVEGMKRIYQHCLRLESERAKKAYGVAGSAVNKVLVVSAEAKPDRVHLILVNEVVGF